MTKLFFTLGVIALGLTLGYSIQRLVASQRLILPFSIAELRKLLQKIGLLFFMYFSFMATVWIIRIDNARITALPFLGVFILLAGGLLALGFARIGKLSRRQTGSFFACGSFSNIGSIGSLAVFMFLGEGAFAYVPLYKLFEEIFYFTVGFPITRYYSATLEDGRDETLGLRLKKVFSDVYVVGALASIAIGGTLNLAGVGRPEIIRSLNAVFIPAGTFVLLTSIGLAMRFSSLRNYLKPGAAVCGIKFVLLPAAACAIAYGLGFDQMDAGLPLKVVLILSAMPVAFTALIPPSLYDLDLDLSNACWLISTLGLLGVLPILYLIVQA